MAHNLTNENSMFYAGATPWHGLGHALPANASWEQVVDLVGFYRVQKQDVYVAGNPNAIPGHVALTRQDTGAFLSMVSDRYGVVDFADMAQAVVTAAGGTEAVFHTGGLLGDNGIRGWLLGELGTPMKVKGDSSEIRRFFLATSAHTGSNPIDLMNCATRVVCQNTLGSALGERNGFHLSIRHTSNAAQRVQDAGVAFRNLQTGYEKFGALANIMASTRMTAAQQQATVDAIFPMPEDASDASGSLLTKREKVASLFDTAKGIEGIRGTAWGVFQAWTEYADHHAKSRAALPAARLDSLMFGNLAGLKAQALNVIADTAGIRL